MKSKRPVFSLWGLTIALMLVLMPVAQAQWKTQSITLKPGWNAVYLHVDVSHISLDDLILIPNGPPISEVWLWQPLASTIQFTTTPQRTSVPDSQWAVWVSSAVVDTLTTLTGNGAYLVRNTDSVDYVWNVKGKPVAPRYDWTTSGLNFIGFPTPAGSAPTMDAFLTPVPEFKRSAEIYRYPGGDLGDNNPVSVMSLLFRSVRVNRGEAFWIRDPQKYNRYFGPVSIHLQNPSGIDFSDIRGTYSVRLKNSTSTSRTVTLDLLESETPPAGQPTFVGNTPLLVRGILNSTNLTYNHSTLPNQHRFTLAAQGQPGSEMELVLGLNRSAMTASAGSLYAGIVRIADTDGLSQVDLPVRATVATTAGLWVGQANVNQIGHYLKTYARDSDGHPILSDISASGAAYVATKTNTELGSVARAFPLRLVLMSDARFDNPILITNQIVTKTTNNTIITSTTNNVVTSGFEVLTDSMLLQRVYFGSGAGTNILVATAESALDPTRLNTARRITATHLPFSHSNIFWPKITGKLGLGQSMEFEVNLDYKDQASNPFLHTFHPDHDNLDVKFTSTEVKGAESYSVLRKIKLTFTSPSTDFASLTAGTGNFGGVYSEIMTFSGRSSNTREFTLNGVFSMNRISTITTLTTH